MAGGDWLGLVAARIQGSPDRDLLGLCAPYAYHRQNQTYGAGYCVIVDPEQRRILARHEGQEAAAHFGFWVGSAGDLDADGVGDYAIGAPGDRDRAPGGALYVYSGATHTQLRRTVGSAGATYFGISFDRIGDLDGDGTDDLGVVVPYDVDAAGASAGGIRLLSGKTGGEIRACFVGADPIWRALRFPDASGDGVADLLVATGRGRVLVMDSKTCSVLHEFAQFAPEVGRGASLARTGDVDGRGSEDVALGFSCEHWTSERCQTASDGGSVYVVSTETREVLWAAHAAGYMGASVASFPDIDGDGADDLLVGAPSDTGGILYLYSGRDGRLLQYRAGPDSDWQLPL
jgi:hypothetical protein